MEKPITSNYAIRIMADVKTRNISTLFLLLGVVFWGGTFSIVKESIDLTDVYSFLFFRFLIASVIITLVFIKRFHNFNAATFRNGVFIGIILAFSFIFQTIGIKYTTASNAAFITGLSVVLVPIIVSVIDKKTPGKMQMAAVAAAFAGLLLLTFRLPFRVNMGDIWVLCCAVSFAFHIILIGRGMRGIDPICFSVIQYLTAALISLAAGIALNGSIAIPHQHVVWKGILYCAIFATAYTYTAQAYYQRNISEIKAAVLYSLEPVFAAVIAFFYLGEIITWKTAIGGLLILAGMFIAELKSQKNISR
jgi:drug/metabolite transporter (DMT)-like permease